MRSARVLGLSPVDDCSARSSCRPRCRRSSPASGIAGAAAILVLIAAEMIGANAGLGYLINYSQYNFLIPQMYAGIITTSVARPGRQLRPGRARAPLLALACRLTLTAHS